MVYSPVTNARFDRLQRVYHIVVKVAFSMHRIMRVFNKSERDNVTITVL